MLINLRNALMSGKRLPYDAEVEYLESTGTQYVNTGVLIDTSTDTVEITFMPHAETSGYQAYYGTDETGNGQFSLRKNTNGNNIQVLKNTAVSAGITADEKWHTVKVTPNKAIVDGVDIALTQSDAQYTKSLMLFARITTADTITAYAKCRVASFKIYRNGTLVRDFIPVRKGTVGYLYDRVTGKLFGNAGTGDFVLGPDVVPVEYLESTGTQYIDTGLFLSSDDTVTVSFSFTSSGGGSLFGAVTSDYAHWFNLTGVGNRLYFGSSTQYNTLSTLPANTICHVECGRNFYVNGVLQHTISATFDDGNLTTPIFARNHVSKGISNFFNGNIYRYTVSRGGSKRIDFRPVRVGTEGAMMDVLTRRIYRNAGTGAFTYGNDLKYPIPAE